MKDMALLNYTFLFDPNNTWQHLSQFESELRDFFTDRGYDAQIIKSINGQSGHRILHICKTVDKVENVVTKPMDPSKQVLNAMKKVGGKNG